MPGKGYMMWKLLMDTRTSIYIFVVYTCSTKGENFEYYKYLSTHEYVIRILIKKSTSNYHMFTTYVVSLLQTIK